MRISDWSSDVCSSDLFEPYIQTSLELFVDKWDKLLAKTSAVSTFDGYASVDCLSWFNYLAFDIIGDLAFGAPFGMLEAGAAVAVVRARPASPRSEEPRVGKECCMTLILRWLMF